MLLYFKKFNKKKLFINTNNFFQPTFECYLADSKSEIKAAQRLRYKVFFAERENKIIRLNSFKRETDDYDKYADHIIVTYKKTKFSKTKVIGTYRLLKQSIALKNIQCSLLVAAGTTDQLVTAEAAQPLTQLTSSTDVTFTLIPGGHLGLMSSKRSADEFWPQLAQWLSERSSKI